MHVLLLCLDRALRAQLVPTASLVQQELLVQLVLPASIVGI